VVMTACRQEMLHLAERALDNDAYAFLCKPFAMEELLRIIAEIQERKQVIPAEGRKK